MYLRPCGALELPVVNHSKRNKKTISGLLKQLGRIFAAPEEDRRSQIANSQITAQPIEACELRVMLSGTNLLVHEADAEFNFLTEDDFRQQLFNAEQFVDAIEAESNVGSVITLVDGVPVDFGAANFASIAESFEPGATSSEDFDSDQIWYNEPIWEAGFGFGQDNGEPPDADSIAVPSPEEPGIDGPNSISATGPVRPETQEYPESDDATDESGITSEDLSFDGASSPPYLPNDSDSFDESFLDADPTGPSQPTSDSTGKQPDPVPTSLTVIIQTDEGILVLHQTTDLDRLSVTRSAAFQAASQIVNRLAAEAKAARTLEVFAPQNPAPTAVPSATSLSDLDAVFQDSRSLLTQLVEASTTGDNSISIAAETENLSGPATADVFVAAMRHGIPISRGASLTVLGLRRESDLTLGPGRQNRRDLTWAAQTRFVNAAKRAIGDGSLVLQLFPALVARDEERSHAELLLQQAREASQPITIAPDLRQTDLLHPQALSVALGGELWNTIPQLEPQVPPDVPAMESLASTLLHSINPRGPPHSQLPDGFSRHEAIRLQHNVLKHSIAPRSPSTGFFN